MVRFTLFGIPVEIQPWFWLTGAMLGGAWHADTPSELKRMLVFMLATAISILVHEFGHALTGRRLGGGQPRVVLTAFGGLAYNEGGRFGKWQRFWMIAAGPGAGFLLMLLTLGVLAAAFGPGDAASLAGHSLFGTGGGLSPATYEFLMTRLPLFSLIHAMLWINFWWGLVNLLPVLPLDGGQIAEIFVKPPQRMYRLAMGTAAAMAVVGLLWMQSWYVALLFGYLAWRNYQNLQIHRY